MSKRTDRSLGTKQYTGYGTPYPIIKPRPKARSMRQRLVSEAVSTMLACVAVAAVVYFLLHT